MSSRTELLALRKELLVARARLQRVRIEREAFAIRESLRLPRAAAAIGASPQGRSALMGLLLLLARGGRLARIARFASAGLIVFQVARVVMRAAGTRQ